MKKLILAALALAASSMGAAAQERWGGTYLGAYLGSGSLGLQSSSWSSSAAAVTTALNNGQLPTAGSDTGTNFIGGLQIGTNIMTSKTTLLGLEADVTLGELRASSSATPNATTFWYATNEATVRWLTTFKGRVGVLVSPSVLLFATGGLALADVEHSMSWGASRNPTATFASGSSSGIQAGLTLGGGGEIALSRDLSLKAEYSYIHFNAGDATTSTYNAAQGATAANTALTAGGLGLDIHQAKIGLIWRY